MTAPDIRKLRYVEIDYLETLKSYFKKYPTPRSAYNIVNIMIWGPLFKAQWMEYKERLILYNETWTCILMPLGNFLSPEELSSVSESFYQSGKCGSVSLVDNEYVSQYRNHLTDFNIVKDFNTADYIYLSERLARLSGKKLQKKKNLISQFIRQYGKYEVEEIDKNDAEECLRLSDQWYEDHPEDKEIGYKYEREALLRAFQFFHELQIEGKIIRLDREIIAFSLFSELKEDMAIIHFEKFNRIFKGAAQLINWETARYLQPRYHYINREEDMGIPGLRKSKQSYQPLMLLDSYKLIRKKMT